MKATKPGHGQQTKQVVSCLSGSWKGLLSSNDRRGSAIVMGCISDPLTSNAAIASLTSLTRWGVITANLSGGRPLHQDRIWRWIGFELANKRSSRTWLAAASNVLLPCAVWMSAFDRAVPEAHIFCNLHHTGSKMATITQLTCRLECTYGG